MASADGKSGEASPLIIDGNATAATIRGELAEEVARLESEHSCKPGLAVVLVGNRTDSATYVRMKKKAAAEIGLHSLDVDLPVRSLRCQPLWVSSFAALQLCSFAALELWSCGALELQSFRGIR
eukprot:scaffold5657_cov270-Pinguiococcus_pyrenoidosus.AAC.10